MTGTQKKSCNDPLQSTVFPWGWMKMFCISDTSINHRDYEGHKFPRRIPFIMDFLWFNMVFYDIMRMLFFFSQVPVMGL